ncbi:MAG: hypothetical protein K8S99_11940 [Planctomycetes bacterium]|nr:hypothetical protein [Planctomycetota bacterium]
MRLNRIRRAAGWLTVGLLASLTTLGVGFLAVYTRGKIWPGLTASTRLTLWLLLMAVALAPWWAMVAVRIQSDRRRKVLA